MSDIEVIEKVDTSTQVKVPSMYQVLLHNDDETTFDFVILVLIRIFHKSTADAIEITKSIHTTGVGTAGGPYTKEVAEEKTLETISFARANSFPLTPTFEAI